MIGSARWVAAALAITMISLSVGTVSALPDDDFTPGDRTGAAHVNAEVKTGLDAFLAQIPFFSFVSDINKDSFEQGETIDLTLKDVAEYACDDAVFVVEAYAPEPPSDRSAEIRTLDHLTGYDPVLSGQMVTADVSLKLPSDAELGEWTVVAYTYCYTENAKIDDGGEIVYKSITVEEPASTGGDSTTSQDPFLTVTEQPSVAVSGTQVRTSLAFKNDGGDMKRAWSVEMQVRPKGGNLLSIADVDDTEELCDPSHPENVHKDFFLTAGQDINIDLTTTVEGGQEYDVWLVTGTACANEGGEPAGPYPSGTLVDTVCVGDCSSSTGGTGGTGGTGNGSGQTPGWLYVVVGVAGLFFVASGVIIYRYG